MDAILRPLNSILRKKITTETYIVIGGDMAKYLVNARCEVDKQFLVEADSEAEAAKKIHDEVIEEYEVETYSVEVEFVSKVE